MRRIEHALILAAGAGRRMAPLTDDVPKALVEYHGRPLIEYALDAVRPHVKYWHVTHGVFGNLVANHLILKGMSPASLIRTTGESNSWWIYNSLLKHLDEPVYVLTCDSVFDLDFAELEADYGRQGSPACMLVGTPPVHGIEGDYIHTRPGTQFITHMSRHWTEPLYATGIQVVNPYEVNALTEEGASFEQTWRQLSEQTQLKLSHVQPSSWRSFDTVEQLSAE